MRTVHTVLLVATALLAVPTGVVIVRNSDRILDLTQSPESRVERARAEGEPALRARFAEISVRYPARRLYFRAFKRERVLEMWAGDATGPMRLVRTYPVAGASGTLGPKRREGDRQVPEGFYFIDRFNPRSRFHLSLGLDYPNASDRVRSDPERPGGDIFIHGDTRSIGCLAMTDRLIREIYVAALDAARPIPVHVFPTRLDEEGMAELRRAYSDKPRLLRFWEELAPGYRRFEATRQVPRFDVQSDGTYRLQVGR